ncbi:phage exclusion protein Lit family protein [Spongiibacter marinus]|uniref:phage exclusion protein Lit family protein n=1 Tax=Spongiibacter marinus TaxID=354246 RepID=UPI0035BE32B2
MEENAEKEIRLLLDGVIPERDDEIKRYLDNYSPYFSLCDDRPGFTIEAGAYGILKFTQRTMHIMWILGFSANQALHSYSSLIALLRINGSTLDSNQLSAIPDQSAEEEKYAALISGVNELAESETVNSFSWPKSVPIPEDGRPADDEGAATFDLICMSGAYVFLHEMKHIAFSLDSNAPESLHEEELQCDLFAKGLMLDKLSNYSATSGYPLNRLITKRAMAIALSQFFMLVITPVESWSGTESHPSISDRISSIVSDLDIHEDDIFWLYASSLFLAHYRYLQLGEIVVNFDSLQDLSMKLMVIIEKASNKSRQQDALKARASA